MDAEAFALLLSTAALLISAGAIFAAVYCRRAFGSLRVTKRQNDLEAQIADLQSSFDDLMESHKRLRSKEGMRELRDRRKAGAAAAQDEPDLDKMSPAERKLYFRRKHFAGMDHRAFALKMQSMDRADSSN